MNRQELIDAVVDVTVDSKAATCEAIEAVLGAIEGVVSTADPVQMIGFGSFSTGQRDVRTGRNPSTGAEIRIRGESTFRFTAGKAFEHVVNTS